MDYGSVASTRVRRPLWKWNLSSSGHSSWRLYNEMLVVVSFRLSKLNAIEVDLPHWLLIDGFSR